MPSLVETGSAVLKEKIFKLCQCIFRYFILSTLVRGVALYLNKLEFPLPKDPLCRVWLKLAQRFWRREFNFSYLIIISPWKRVQPFNKFEDLSPKVPCAKFSCNWHGGSGEVDHSLNVVKTFLLFRNYLPLEKGLALHLNKHESP